jgi:hypothetical protein
MTLASGERALPVVLAFFPPALLSKSLTDLGNMASNDTGAFGLSLANVTSYCAHNTTTGTECAHAHTHTHTHTHSHAHTHTCMHILS